MKENIEQYKDIDVKFKALIGIDEDCYFKLVNFITKSIKDNLKSAETYKCLYTNIKEFNTTVVKNKRMELVLPRIAEVRAGLIDSKFIPRKFYVQTILYKMAAIYGASITEDYIREELDVANNSKYIRKRISTAITAINKRLMENGYSIKLKSLSDIKVRNGVLSLPLTNWFNNYGYDTMCRMVIHEYENTEDLTKLFLIRNVIKVWNYRKPKHLNIPI